VRARIRCQVPSAAGLDRNDVHTHVSAFIHYSAFLLAGFRQIYDQPLQEFAAKLSMGQLATPKAHRQLDPVALSEELFGATQLGLVIVLLDAGLHAKLFLLAASRFGLIHPRPLLLLVSVPPVIHHPADGRFRVRRDFDQIQPHLLGTIDGVSYVENPDLLAIGTDYANFRNANLVVYPGAIFPCLGAGRPASSTS